MNKKILLATITVFFLLAGCQKVTPTNTAQQNGQSPLVAATTNSAVAKSPTTTTATAVVTQDPATTIAPSLTAETKKQPYSITTATFSQDNIKIQYPQIKGLGDNSKEKTINDLIKNDVLNSQVEAPTKYYQDATNTKVKLTLDLKYQVTMNTNELLSVIYTGDVNIEGSAHPTKAIYAITIDLKNATKLKLSDFTIIDTNLAQKIKQSTAVTNEAVKNGMDKNDLITAIQNTDDQTLIKGLKEEWAYNTFYVTPNSLVVSVDVDHASGDYALIELPGQYTKK
jgi:hypothetical protein